MKAAQHSGQVSAPRELQARPGVGRQRFSRKVIKSRTFNRQRAGELLIVIDGQLIFSANNAVGT
jgi:hypothetical protein